MRNGRRIRRAWSGRSYCSPDRPCGFDRLSFEHTPLSPFRTLDDGVRKAIAIKIIELAKAGERNPDALCQQVLKDIRNRAS
jgi:hypothetical protein